jgi:phosphatidylethanolamine/phosphatidyl-N-methylethanolamine N-methyltransferase
MSAAGVLVTDAVGKELPAELDRVSLRKAYARWAPVYDLVFGAVFERGRQAATAAAEQVGGRILEVGVGTGISLPGYSSQNRITGIDLSQEMLRKAQRRVADLSLGNVEKLEVMDAEHLSFADASFDVVVANHVISTVPNPEAALDECARMLRPARTIVATDRLSARMAGRVSLGPIRSLGRTAYRCAPDRAPADAAVRSFLAPEICEIRTRSGSVSTAGRRFRS